MTMIMDGGFDFFPFFLSCFVFIFKHGDRRLRGFVSFVSMLAE